MSVDFPDPEGPIKATNSPLLMVKDTDFRACMVSAPITYLRPISLMVISGSIRFLSFDYADRCFVTGGSRKVRKVRKIADRKKKNYILTFSLNPKQASGLPDFADFRTKQDYFSITFATKK